MKDKILKGLLSLILITMALPVQSQDFMNIYLKSGEFRKFYMKNVTEISASKYDAAGVQHSDYEYQIIKTVNEEFIYNLQDVDSITFTSIDEEQAIESFVSAIKEISPIIESCESIEEIESRIDDIKSAKGVEKAWSDGHVLSVRTTGGETITFHKSHHNNADEENASIKKAVKRIIMSAQKFALIKNNKDIRCAIVNQPHNDNSYNLRRDNIILPTQNILNQYGVKTDYIPNPTLDFFYNNSSNPDSYNLYDYDFVILLTHGSYDYIEEFDKNKYDLFKIHEFATSEELGKKRFNVLLDSDEKILHNKLQELRDKYNSTDYEISLFVCDEERDGKTYLVYYAGVTESFFINSAKGKFKNPNSVLFNSACESLKGNKNFATIFRDKRDLGVYLGYDESDAKGEVAAYYLVTGLLNSSSLEMAYENIPDQIKNEQNEDGIISHLKRIPETDNNTNGLFLVKPYTVAVTQEDMDNAINNGNVINIEGYVSYCDSENGINVGFKYGFDKDNLTEKVPTTSSELVSNEGLGNLKVTTTLSNLQHGKTYYYRVFTTDGKYDNDGDICSFTIPNDLQLSSDKIILTIGETSTIQIISGSGDYGITGLDDASTIATVTLQGTVITINPIKAGDAIFVVTDMQTGKQKILSITINKPNPLTIAEAIDLGLPSGTKWADRNVGASKPEESGEYYAWGEIVYKPNNCTVSTYSLCTDGDKNTCVSLGNIAGTEYDVAHVKWGGDWIIPNMAQAQELLDYCTFEWVEKNSVWGFNVTGQNGNTIFIPASGCRHGGTHQNDGVGIDLWLSEESDYYNYGAAELSSNYYGDQPYIYQHMSRYLGLFVRPVISSNDNPLSVSLTYVSVLVGDTFSFDITSGNGEYRVDYIGEASQIFNVTVRGSKLTLNALQVGEGKFTVTDITGKMVTVNVTVADPNDQQDAYERKALVELFNSTNGSYWLRKDNWCSNEPVGTWYGISTDNEGLVQYISLQDNNLQGSITISNFPSLYNISLTGNNISSLTIDSCASLDLGYGFNLDGIILDSLTINNCLYDMGQHFMSNVKIKNIIFSNFKQCGRIFLDNVTSEQILIRDCYFDSQAVGVENGENPDNKVDTFLVERCFIGSGRLGGDVDHLIIKDSQIESWWLIGAKSSITLENTYVEGHLFNISGTAEEVDSFVRKNK